MKTDNTIYLRSVMERMTTEQLDELLHEELAKETPNGELVRQALRVLEERERDIPVEMTPEIEAAWERYRETEEPVLDKPVQRRGWILKVASVAVVLTVLVAALAQPAEAKNFFDRLISWTDSFFQLLSPGDAHGGRQEYIFKTDNPGLQEVYDAVVELGITDPVVPMWLPEGFELVNCKMVTTPTCKGITAEMVSTGGIFVFKVDMYNTIVTNEYYKDKTQLKTKEIGGTVHNIMENNAVWTVVWSKDNIECSFLIECQEDTLYKILGSIYTTED